MKQELSITFEWWTSGSKSKISNQHRQALEEAAIDRINECRSEGFTSGELLETIEDIEYRGFWSMTTTVIQ